MNMRSLRGGALALALGFGSSSLLGGCGTGSADDTAKPLSPEMEAKTRDMLKNYGKQYAEQGRAKAKARRKK